MLERDSVLPAGGPGDLRLWCSIVGGVERPPVLFLHGITASRRYWLPRVLGLAERHRLLAPDLPGFGRSPKPYADYTMEFFCECVEGLVDRLYPEGRELAVVGHSLGSLIALELAARRPRRVGRVALLNLPRFENPEVAHRVMLEGSSSYRSLLTVNSFAATWSSVRRTGLRFAARSMRRLPWNVLSDSRRFTFRSLTSTLEHCLMHHRPDGALRRFPPGRPLLLIHGEQDQVAPLAPLRRLLDDAPPHRLEVLTGGGHHVLHTHTAACLGLLEEFLAGG